MLVMAATMVAFAGAYALLATLLTENRSAIAAALRNGNANQAGGIAASRCLSRA